MLIEKEAGGRPAGTASAWTDCGSGRWIRHGGWPVLGPEGWAAEISVRDREPFVVRVRRLDGTFLSDLSVRWRSQAFEVADALLDALGWHRDGSVANQPGAARIDVKVAGGAFQVVTPGWTLDEPDADPANAAPDQCPGKDMPLPARLRRWAEAHTPAGVTATAPRALLSEAADEIDRLAEEQRKIIDLCGRGGDAGVTAVQAVAQMRERLDAVEESAEAARAEWLDRDLGT